MLSATWRRLSFFLINVAFQAKTALDPPYSTSIIRAFWKAPLAELVDALDSKSSSFGSAGSIPAGGTIFSFIMVLAFSELEARSALVV